MGVDERCMKTVHFTSPKHGAVIHLTAEEVDKLENYWQKNKRKYIPMPSVQMNIITK